MLLPRTFSRERSFSIPTAKVLLYTVFGDCSIREKPNVIIQEELGKYYHSQFPFCIYLGYTKNKDGRGAEDNDRSCRSTCFNFYRHRYSAVVSRATCFYINEFLFVALAGDGDSIKEPSKHTLLCINF